MLLASIDFCDIIDRSKEPLPSNMDSEVKMEYQRRVKEAMSIIGLNLVNKQLTHIISCKGPVKA